MTTAAGDPFQNPSVKGNYIVSFIPRSGSKHYCPIVMKEERKKRKRERREGRKQ